MISVLAGVVSAILLESEYDAKTALEWLPFETVRWIQQEAALEGRNGGTLLAIGDADGMTLADYDLESPPIFDGMVAADGRLYVAAMNGSVVCLGRVVPKDQ